MVIRLAKLSHVVHAQSMDRSKYVQMDVCWLRRWMLESPSCATLQRFPPSTPYNDPVNTAFLYCWILLHKPQVGHEHWIDHEVVEVLMHGCT